MGRSEDLLDRLLLEREAAIDALIEDRASEELFLDFKQSSDDGAGSKLSSIDRNHLAKAIAGFGNSEGGVIVWGVECSPRPDGADVAKAKRPLADAKRFVSWLQGAVSGCTVPPHANVAHHAIGIAGGRTGFAVTHVPKSAAAPLQVVGKGIYYIRAGSNFVPAPHGVIAGLFGRAPQPDVFHKFLVLPARLDSDRIIGEVGILVRNNGPGIAKDIFVNTAVTEQPGPPSEFTFNPTDLENWRGAKSFGFQASLISIPGFRLPPEAWAQPVVLGYALCPPFERGFELSIVVGSGNSVPHRFRSKRTAQEFRAAYEEFVSAWDDPQRRGESAQSFPSLLFPEGKRA